MTTSIKPGDLVRVGDRPDVPIIRDGYTPSPREWVDIDFGDRNVHQNIAGHVGRVLSIGLYRDWYPADAVTVVFDLDGETVEQTIAPEHLTVVE